MTIDLDALDDPTRRYCIILSTRVERLAKGVETAIDKGWEPQGAPFLVHHNGGNTVFHWAQAVVRLPVVVNVSNVSNVKPAQNRSMF